MILILYFVINKSFVNLVTLSRKRKMTWKTWHIRKSCKMYKWMACEHLYTLWIFSDHFFMKWLMMSMGRGKMMVEFFSAAMVLRVWRYLSWRADGDSEITRDASFRALDAFISPSAAITYIITTIILGCDITNCPLNVLYFFLPLQYI